MQESATGDVWHYEENGQRKGGVSEAEIAALIQSGKLSYGSVVWKEGMTEWMSIESTKLKSHLTNIPPPLAGEKINNSIVWVLAFAPVIGYVLEWVVAYAVHKNDFLAALAVSESKYWFITVGLNIGLGVADERRLKHAGHNTDKFKGWVWLVPVYLYQRASFLKQSKAYFIVWLVCFFLLLIE